MTIASSPPARNTFRTMAALGLVASSVFGLINCGGTTNPGGASGGNSGDGGSASGASSNGGSASGGASPASGGRIGGGGSMADGGVSSGGALGPLGGGPAGGGSPAGGEGGQGGQGAICELPFEVGDCDAAIPVYYHNAETGRCEPATYGGCGGNGNRFEVISDCEEACDVRVEGVGCEVKGRIYRHGATGVPDPWSCNTCSCSEGQITGCTEKNCPVDPCAEGRSSGTECAECGPTDACLTVRYTCFPLCGPTDECVGGGVCNNGICRPFQMCG